ncbi:unnamed protein product [Closterium sp. NIES-54]
MERTSSWLVDSGASSHICSDRSLFSSLKKPNEEILVRFGGGETYKVLGVGTVVATLRSPTSETTIQLDNVLFLPSSVHNLLSVRALGAAGVAVLFPAAGRVVLTSDDVHIGEGYTRNNLFYLQLHHGSSAAPSIKPTACPASTTTSSYLWHRRFGHLNMQALSTLHRQQLVTGLHLSSTSIPPCISCYRGKQTRQPFGVSHSRTTAPLQLIHSDIAGPLSYGTTIGGARYLLTFIDDSSRHITVYLLRHRSEALSCFKAYVTRVHNMHSPHTIKTFRSDGALEFTSKAFTSFLTAHGIARHLSTPYTPEQNGVAERANRTLLEMVRSMLHDAHMDKVWWGEAALTAAYLRNHAISRGGSTSKTPMELWTGARPDVSHLRIFGSPVLVLIPSQRRSKLDDRSTAGIMVGYGHLDGTKAYRIYIPSQHARGQVSRYPQNLQLGGADYRTNASIRRHSRRSGVV